MARTTPVVLRGSRLSGRGGAGDPGDVRDHTIAREEGPGTRHVRYVEGLDVRRLRPRPALGTGCPWRATSSDAVLDPVHDELFAAVRGHGAPSAEQVVRGSNR